VEPIRETRRVPLLADWLRVRPADTASPDPGEVLDDEERQPVSAGTVLEEPNAGTVPEEPNAGTVPEEDPTARSQETILMAGSGSLLVFCAAVSAMVFSHLAQGVRQALFCGVYNNEAIPAPAICVVPLVAAGVSCHCALVMGLMYVARFAWRSWYAGFEGNGVVRVETLRDDLSHDLIKWRTRSVTVLAAASAVFMSVGAPCAGFSRMAIVFLASGFLVLYATTMFLSGDFETMRVQPRMIRIALVYFVVTATFVMYRQGMAEKWEDFSKQGIPVLDMCNASTRQSAAPMSCTVPLDLSGGICVWWAASPLFSMLLPPDPDLWLRKWLRHSRRQLDCLVLSVAAVALLVTGYKDDGTCRRSAPFAFGNAEVGCVIVGLVAVLRCANPSHLDGWRGPLDHLGTVHLWTQVPGECSICLEDLSSGPALCRTRCGHDFHRVCLEEWALHARFNSPACPVCRVALDSMSSCWAWMDS